MSKRKSSGFGRSALPSGSFTIDSTGALIASTVSSRFPQEYLHQVSKLVVQTFIQGRENGLALTEFQVKFGAMSIRAVEMRGGALIFLTPRGDNQNRLQGTR
jgi:hypothetical protein